MLTYETLQKIEQEEKVSQKLVHLPERFLQEVREYLEKKEAISKEKGDKWELKTSLQRFKNILELRERKLVNFTLSCVRSDAIPENMLREERELFENIVRKLHDFHKKRESAISGDRPIFKTLTFLQTLPQFVGIDMGYYGPYEHGDIATVPAENAKLLIEKGAAEVIEN